MPREKIRAAVGDATFDFEWDGSTLFRNGLPLSLEVIEIGSDQFAVRFEGSNHSVVLEDQEDGHLSLRRYDGLRRVRVLDRRDLLLEEMGLSTDAGPRHREVRAPMPGLVLSVLVKAGDAVSKGDGLVVLEAMKMENEMRAPHDGIVSSISVAPGDAVVKNAVLVEFAD